MSNILEVINLFLSAENFIGPQFRYLNERGANMHLICSPAERLDAFAKEQGIAYKSVALERQLSPFKDLKALIAICKYIRKNKINVIVGHQVKGRLLSVLAGKIMRVPKIIIFAHGALFETSRGLKRKLLLWESKFESFCADYVVCVSRSVSQVRLKEKIDVVDKQVILGKGTCGGIDTQDKFNPERVSDSDKKKLKQQLRISDSDIIIGFCGRLVKDKGVIELVEGFKLLKGKYPYLSFKLLVVGPLEKRDSIPLELVEYMKSSQDIVFTGFVDGNMELYYSIMSLLILPSYREGFPTAVLEASAMEKPILTSRKTGCIDSIIDGETGFYIDISPSGICCGIEKLLSAELRKEMGRNAREWVVENFDHRKVWPYIEKLLIEEKNGKAIE